MATKVVDLDSLVERRASDRRTMAALVCKAASDYGCAAESTGTPDEVSIRVSAPGGLRLVMWFSRSSLQPDNHCLAWTMAPGKKHKLSPSLFPDVNTHHGQKCTEFRRGFRQALHRVHEVLAAAVNGTAYDWAGEPEEPSYCPRCGSSQIRNAGAWRSKRADGADITDQVEWVCQNCTASFWTHA